MTAIFLDVDGVLNCVDTEVFVPGTSIFGVEDRKADLLRQISDMAGGARIILTSTWKFTWEKDGPKDIDSRYLAERLAAHGMTIGDKTEDDYSDRGAGIRKYLSAHPDITSFLILDDNMFDFEEQKLKKYLVRTSFAEGGGLQRRHLGKAKKILRAQGVL